MDSKTTLREIQKQNRFVFKNLFENFYEDLVHYSQSYLFDKNASEDIVQEIFIHLWEKANDIEIKTSLKAYMYAMTRNRCLNFLKSIKITDSSHILELHAVIDNEYDLDAFSNDDKKIISNQVLKIVASLPDKMQAIIKLRFMENYKYSEIAEELGISINTVKTQLKRAKIKIGELIAGLLILLSLQH